MSFHIAQARRSPRKVIAIAMMPSIRFMFCSAGKVRGVFVCVGIKIVIEAAERSVSYGW